jgi:hypothetical protein
MDTFSPTYDPVALDAQDAQNRALVNQLYWLTNDERSPYRLADDPAWPGLYPEPADMQRFVEMRSKGASRQVECRFHLGYAEVPGRYDLVTGEMLVVYDGQYQLAQDFPEWVTVQFQQVEPVASLFVKVENGAAVLAPENGEKRELMTLGQLLKLPPRSASAQQVTAVVERLDSAGKLPAVEYAN